MGIALKTTLTLVGSSLRCVIPKPVCDQLGLERGDVLQVTLEGSKVVLEKSKEDRKARSSK